MIYGLQKTVESLDPTALDLMRQVVKKTGSVICLSSDWRLYHNYMELGKQLGLPILFETNHDKEQSRAQQIQEVIDGLKPEKYAIVDDEEDEDEFHGMTWVNVSEEDGFSYMNYLLLLEYLKD